MRTETVISDTRDFGIGRRVNAENWHALRTVGESANQRLCDAQAANAQPAPDVVTFNQVARPSDVDGLHAPGLRFGDPPVMAVMAAIVGFSHLIVGFNNRQLTDLGRRVAVLFTKAHGRLLTPGLVELDPRLPDDLARRSPLAPGLAPTRPSPSRLHRQPARRGLKRDLTVNFVSGKRN